MITILLRTLLLYFFLVLTMRLMGKRQIGELELTDLVTTLLLSEIASLPITNLGIPVSHAIIPMLTLLGLEVLSSFILIRMPSLRGLVSAKPTVLVQNGKLNQQALTELRISMEELMSELRQQGISELAQVRDVIAEKNGKLTVFPRAEYSTPTAKQMGLQTTEEGLMHIVYLHGRINREGLRLIQKDSAWLREEFDKKGLRPETLFCVTANQGGTLYWIEKEQKK